MIVDKGKCTLCLECVKVCPKTCIYPTNEVIARVHDACAICEYCLDVCPEDAIRWKE